MYALTVAECFVDGQAKKVELKKAWQRAWKTSANRTVYDPWNHVGAALTAHQAEQQTVLLRDIFGNPFRSITINSAWLTTTVVSLAAAIYDERAFDRLPILADALEDAGCDHADILNHCRSEGPHVRGCWALDLVLGKK